MPRPFVVPPLDSARTTELLSSMTIIAVTLRNKPNRNIP